MKREPYYAHYQDWDITWESTGHYRIWCYQKHQSHSKDVAVVMLNPGALSGDGANLSQDTTLRILRELFLDTKYNPYIINLFNYATPEPVILFENWDKRDCEGFDYQTIETKRFSAVMYAYGDYENGTRYAKEIRDRINAVRSLLSGIPEFDLPLNKSGTPKHPLAIQRQKLKVIVRDKIKQFANHAEGGRRKT